MVEQVKRQAVAGELRATELAWSAKAGILACLGPGLLHLVPGAREAAEQFRLPGPAKGRLRFLDSNSLACGPYLFDIEARKWLELPDVEAVITSGMPGWEDRFRIAASCASPDGEELVIAGQFVKSRTVRPDRSPPVELRLASVNLRTRQPLALLHESADAAAVRSLDVSAGHIAAGGTSVVHLWRRANHQQLAELTLNGYTSVLSVCFSPQGESLAAAAADGCILRAKLNEWPDAKTWQAHDRPIDTLAWLDGGALASGSRDGKLRVWDNSGNLQTEATFDADVEAVCALDGEALAVAAGGHVFRLGA